MSSEAEGPDASGYVSALAKALRAERERQQYTQEGFAWHARVDRGQLGGFERGRFDMRFATVMGLLEALEVQPGEFFRAITLPRNRVPKAPRPTPAAKQIPFKAPKGATYGELLGALVQHAREQQGYNQEEFAREAGYARSWLSGLERGRGNPTFTVLMRALEALGIQPADFFAHIKLRPKSERAQPAAPQTKRQGL